MNPENPIDPTNTNSTAPQSAQTPEPSAPNPQAPITSGSDKKSKSLAIALAVGLVLLLAAAGIAIWMISNQSATPTPSTQQPQDSSQITKASFVAPQGLPSKYVKQDKSTNDRETFIYFDNTATCGLTTDVVKLDEGVTPDQAVDSFIESAAQLGVTVANSVDGADILLSDADNAAQQYTLKARELVQNVNVPNAGFDKQNNVVAYTQLGGQVATISYSCKDTTWGATKAELEAIVKQFTIKTERN